ncbi:MAG TPA: DUF1330 domain-containing protein [Fibrobacteria bacterium]|nr:DUF1330 domain-containing protein [Fibrobacteria bacterium]
MLHVIAHLYLQPGMEVPFRDYETEALRVFRAHGGTLVAAFRPEPRAGTGGDSGPDEIHVLTMPSRDRFEAWRSSAEVTASAALRARVIRKTELFLSREPVEY